MALQFDSLDLNRQEAYTDKLRQSPWEASDYSFINIWGWGPEYGLEWAWSEGLIWLRQTQAQTLYWAPPGPWEEIDWKDRLNRLFPEKTDFIRIPETLLRLWQAAVGDRIQAEEAEEHWDYLYSVPELVNLSGNKFHKKKNLLNQFLRNYDFEYHPLTPDLVQKALDMQDSWCEWRDCEEVPPLAAENRAIQRVFKDWDRFEKISGGAILIDGEVVAFDVSEEVNPETLLIHFEKGLLDYKGIYQAINQMHLAAGNGYKIVNREQDLGDEGLRKAKLSYHPIDYVRKYNVTLL